MKILNICMGAPFTEGYSYQDNLLSEYQHKLGHEVTVLTTTRTRNSEGKIIEIEEETKFLENGVRLIRVKAGNKLKQFLGYYPEIKKYIRDIHPDMIFVHGLGTLVMKDAVAYKKNNKNAVIVADNHQDKVNTNIKSIMYIGQLTMFNILWKYWICYVDRVYGTTAWRKKFAEEAYGITTKKTDILTLGVDTDHLSKDKEGIRNGIRTELEIEDNSFVYIAGGKINRKKHILEAIKAFLQIKGKAYFIIFGPLHEEIKSEFELLISKSDRIKYIGSIESKKIYQYFYAADFAVFPGFHSVLWEEAVGCGIPCLFRKYEEKNHTDICGNCICVENPNVQDIYIHMEKVYNDNFYYQQLKSNAAIAANSFSYYEVAKKSIECTIVK